ISLNDRNGNASRLDDALKAVIARAEVEGLFLEHWRHAPAEGKKPGMREHGQLEFSVAVHELRVGEKVEPVFDRLVEGAEQALVGDVHYGLPAQLPMVVAKLDFGTDLAVFGLEAVFLELRRVETNVLLPAVKVINPVVEIGNPQHEGTTFSRG